MKRRTLLQATAALAPSLATQWAQAQDKYPNKPITWVCPYAAGGNADSRSRQVAKAMSTILGQPIIIDNKAGAGGNIGAEIVAKSAPDGYTWLMASVGTHGINLPLYTQGGGKLPFDPIKDFTPISLVAELPNVLVLNPEFAAKNNINTVNDLIAYAKANPGKVRYGSSGPGSASHLAGELFASMAGLELLHVPYKGTGQALTDLLAGHIDLMFAPAQTVMPQIESGKLIALAQTGAKRSEALPNIPTVIEAGLSGYSAVGWFGLFAPANTPKSVVQKINQTVMFVLSQDRIRKAMLERGSDPASGSADDFAAFLRSDQSKWAKLIKENKVAVQ